MPIHFDISHLDRLVVAAIVGEVTPDDLANVARQFREARTQRYGKIIDASAGVAVIDETRLAAIAAFMRADPKAAERGPLAFVVDAERGKIADRFAALTAGERPVKVFISLHEARKWIRKNMKNWPPGP
ncbi:MAG: hypothetical protein K9G48_02835 [Reyranella sp.]|nr:hypothetical protein [Reyranella sp.]